jgi:hypothetical protein
MISNMLPERVGYPAFSGTKRHGSPSPRTICCDSLPIEAFFAIVGKNLERTHFGLEEIF